MSEPQELQVIEQTKGLDSSRAAFLSEQFQKFLVEAKKWEAEAKAIVVTSSDQVEEMKRARATRLTLQKVRTRTEETRKTLKEASLREGKAIDGIANIIKAVIVPLEEHLEAQESFAEREKQKEIDALRETRAALLLEVDIETSTDDLGTMSEELFSLVYNNAKKQKAEREEAASAAELARIEAEKQAAIEAERLKVENERQKKEMEAERAKLATERAAMAEKQAELDRIASEQAAAKKALELEREKKLAEEQLAKEARQAEIDRIESEKHKAATAPDREKLLELAGSLRETWLPDVSSDRARQILEKLTAELEVLSGKIRKAAETL